MELTHILDVAEQQFFWKEYQEVKLDTIARELGIKKPSLYYYFKTKREFFLKTLDYSTKKYLGKMREVIATWDLFDFLHRYLAFPSKEHNLFAIASQQWYGDDREITYLVNHARTLIDKETEQFLTTFTTNEVKIYLVMELLDKLAMDNCTDWYCLDYSLTDLSEEIEEMIRGCKVVND